MIKSIEVSHIYNPGNTITTNNNYNFIQNNYSPEPIDRTELYTQTENQHYTLV